MADIWSGFGGSVSIHNRTIFSEHPVPNDALEIVSVEEGGSDVRAKQYTTTSLWQEGLS